MAVRFTQTLTHWPPRSLLVILLGYACQRALRYSIFSTLNLDSEQVHGDFLNTFKMWWHI